MAIKGNKKGSTLNQKTGKGSYTKNVLRSLRLTSTKALKELNPVIAETFSENKDFIKSKYESLRSNNTAKDSSKEYSKMGQNLVKNLFKDLNSGKFYNEDRLKEASKEILSSFGFEDFDMDDFDFDDDEIQSNSDSESFFDEENNVNNIKNNNVFLNISKDEGSSQSIVESSSAIIKNNSAGFTQVSSLLSDILEFHNTRTNGFYNEMSEKITAMSNSISRLEKIMAANTESNMLQLQSTGKATEELLNNNILSIENIINNLKKSNPASGMGDMMGGFIKGSIAEIVASPLSFLGTSLIKALIPKKVKKKMESVNDIASQAPLLLNLLGNNLSKNKTGLLSSLGGLLVNITGGNIKNNDKMNFGVKNKFQATPFDIETKTTINRVIPSLLSKILASVSNDNFYKQEIVYDMDNGGFVSSKDYSSNFKRKLDNSMLRNSSAIDAKRGIKKFSKSNGKELNNSDIDKVNDYLRKIVEEQILDPKDIKVLENDEIGKIVKDYFSKNIENRLSLGRVAKEGSLEFNKTMEKGYYDNTLAMALSNDRNNRYGMRLLKDNSDYEFKNDDNLKLKEKIKKGFNKYTKINNNDKDDIDFRIGDIDNYFKTNKNRKNKNINLNNESSSNISYNVSSNLSSEFETTHFSFMTEISSKLDILSIIASTLSEFRNDFVNISMGGEPDDSSAGDYSMLSNSFGSIGERLSGIKTKIKGFNISKFFKKTRKFNLNDLKNKFFADKEEQNEIEEEGNEKRKSSEARIKDFTKNMTEFWESLKSGKILERIPIIGDLFGESSVLSDLFGADIGKGIKGLGNKAISLAKNTGRKALKYGKEGFNGIQLLGDTISGFSGNSKLGKFVGKGISGIGSLGNKALGKIGNLFGKKRKNSSESSSKGIFSGSNTIDLSHIPDGVTPVWIVGSGKNKSKNKNSDNDEKETLKEKTKRKAEEAKEWALDKAQRAKIRAEEAKEWALDKAQRAKERILQSTHKAKERAKESAQNLKEWALDTAHNVKERLSDTIHNKLKHAFSSVVEKIKAGIGLAAEGTQAGIKVSSAVPVIGKGLAIAAAVAGIAGITALGIKAAKAIKSAKQDKDGNLSAPSDVDTSMQSTAEIKSDNKEESSSMEGRVSYGANGEVYDNDGSILSYGNRFEKFKEFAGDKIEMIFNMSPIGMMYNAGKSLFEKFKNSDVYKQMTENKEEFAQKMFSLTPVGALYNLSKYGLDPDNPSYKVTGLIGKLFDKIFNLFGGSSSISSNTASLGTSVGSSSLTLSGNSNEEKAWNFFKQKGLSDEATAAIIGNLQQESGIDPSAVNSSSGAKGIAQWMGGRYNNLVSYAQSKGTSWNDLQTQLEFLWQELNSNDINNRMTGSTGSSNLNGNGISGLSSGWSGFQNLNDINYATKLYEAAVERSGGSALSKRVNYANQAYSNYAGKSYASTTSNNAGGSKFDQWVANNIGKKLDVDDYAGAQCVDVAKSYFKDVIGITPMLGNGIDYYNNRNNADIQKHFQWIDYTKGFIPRKGDVVASTSSSQYGHVAIATGEGDQNYYYSYDQNFEYPQQPMTKLKHPYTNMLGVLRPRNQSVIGTGMPNITNDSSTASLSGNSSNSSNIFSDAYVTLSEADKQAILDDELQSNAKAFENKFGYNPLTNSSSGSSSSASSNNNYNSMNSSSGSSSSASSSSSSKPSNNNSSTINITGSDGKTTKIEISCACAKKETYDYEKYSALKDLVNLCNKIGNNSDTMVNYLKDILNEIKKTNNSVSSEQSNSEENNFGLDFTGLEMITKGF